MSGMPVSADGQWCVALRAKPVRNTAARVVEKSENSVTVYVKKQRPAWLVPPVSWIVPFRPERQVTLDRLGTEVWRFCDGKRTVEEIADIFGGRYRLTFHESRTAVSGYLKALVQRGVLAMVMQEET